MKKTYRKRRKWLDTEHSKGVANWMANRTLRTKMKGKSEDVNGKHTWYLPNIHLFLE